jgi:hypothetical protein
MKLKKLSLLLICIFVLNLNAMNVSDKNDIKQIINTIKSKNKYKIADIISYPLSRVHPLSDIKDKKDFEEKFDYIFDSNLLNLISTSKIDEDYSRVGYRGVIFKRGLLWIDDGKIIAINYSSKKELEVKKLIESDERNIIHSSLKGYSKARLNGNTKKFHIRIDELKNGKYRYSSWSKTKSISDKPDLVLVNGKVKFEGSGGNHHYTFKNNKYTYRCHVIIIGHDTSPPGILEVLKGEKVILSKPFVNLEQ